ncbi:SLC13 family permease [Trueperella sp. LYQ143]|uniref:SLC13 family permease n=1 Tax=unclassified Trueperella TaxID=2630174 RepID=UPI00398372C7
MNRRHTPGSEHTPHSNGSRWKQILRGQAVLIIATIAALCSLVVVPPDSGYRDYVDWHTLGVLFALLLILAAGKEIGIFALVGRALIRISTSRRGLVFSLVFLCFFSSMLLTNDVALITFVPLALFTLHAQGDDRAIPGVVVLQTIAANTGAMLTPLGSPQNLYLSHAAPFSFLDIGRMTLPYVLAAGVCLALAIVATTRGGEPVVPLQRPTKRVHPRRAAAYGVLFVLAVGTVAGVIPLWFVLGSSICVVLYDNPYYLTKVDYSLLATFLVLFVFVGNMGRVPAIHDVITSMADRSVRMAALGASQIISNVPATLLLSGFTHDYEDLLIGVNIGGLGTLIASMASLISYRFIAANLSAQSKRFIGIFTMWNLAFLAVFLLLSAVL